jgi:hypothetical protein
VQKVQGGSLARLEEVLAGQAIALNAMFTELSRMSSGGQYQKQLDLLIRLALKAQSLFRTTVETLSLIKMGPRSTVFARQANIANGPQQVNNAPGEGSRARARKTRNQRRTKFWRHMATGWTPERREKQAAAIRSWRPWEHSTGPRTAEGKARSSRNAYRGGLRRTIRELSKILTAELRAQREELRRIRW